MTTSIFNSNCRRFNGFLSSLRGTNVIARYEAIHFRRHCEVRSNPGCPLWIASYLAMTIEIH
ncbi:MAG: hypothetical protein LBS88_07340 [Tannerellaceae bacterium]|nr:hypothetical protein [Tannerellaceae bacterium]